MVFYIAHRVNTIDDAKTIPGLYGIECDIRDGLVVTHDHGTTGIHFKEFAETLKDRPLVILNVKCEGVEHELLKHITFPYFFLDCGFPMIYKLSNNGNKNVAIRFSEYEGMDLVRNMAGKVDWVWVDTFHGTYPKIENLREIKKLGYKICIMSPELQKLSLSIKKYANYLRDNSIEVDAVCTKLWNIQTWKDNLKL
jgi:hypothetical protein